MSRWLFRQTQALSEIEYSTDATLFFYVSRISVLEQQQLQQPAIELALEQLIDS
jgi:hypothetical protein